MSDKTIIVEIQYDTGEAKKNLNDFTSEANKKVSALTDEIYDLQEANKRLASEMKNVKGTSEQDLAIKKKLNQEIQINKDRIKSANRERTESIKSITGEKTAFDKLNENLKANTKAQKESTGALSAMPGATGGAIKGIMGMVKASLAFIATPLGAVIAAIVLGIKALISYFKGSEEGQNKWNKIMAIGGAIIGNLGDTFRDFGKLILDSIMVLGARFQKFFANIGLGWEKLKGVFKDNTAAIEEQRNKIAEADKILTERQDERRKSAEELKAGLRGIVDETKKEIEIAKNLADRQAALDLLQRKFLVDRAKLEAQIEDAKAKAVDKENYTAEQRIKFLQESIKKEEEILNTNEKIAKEKLAIKKAQTSLSDSTKEDLDEQAQLEADLYNVQKENATKRAALTSQLIAIQGELNSKTKAQTAEQEKANELDKKLQEEILKRRAEAIAKLSEIEYNRILNEEKNFEARKELMIAQAEEELAIKLEQDGILQEEVELAEAEHKARLLEIDKEYNDAIAANREANLQATYESMQQIIAATKGMAGARATIIGDTFSKIATINYKELKSYKDTFMAIAQAAQGLTQLITAGHEQELTDLENKKAYELSLVGDNKEAQDAINQKYARKEAELKTKQAKEDKTAAIIDATIATALGIVNALANSGNPILGIVMAALIGLLGGYQIASIASQPTPTFSYAKGGIIGGKSHAQGGTKFYGEDGSMFEAERGEAMFVMKKDATAEIAALSAINESFGGRSFTGKSSSHLAEGGQMEAIDMQNAIQSEIQRTPIVVKVGDIQTGLTDYSNSKEAGVI